MAVGRGPCPAESTHWVLSHRSHGDDGGGASDDAASSPHQSHHPTKFQQETVSIGGKVLFYF